jgi:hypothetical protein
MSRRRHVAVFRGFESVWMALVRVQASSSRLTAALFATGNHFPRGPPST